MTDSLPFFIRPYHAREEDKKVIDKEMKCLCYLGILKEGFPPYSILIVLISQKLTQDKRVVIDFRHLNIRIAKNNLAYPLVRDTFSVLGNSKCEVLSVLDLKDAFHSLSLLEEAKKYCGILPYFGSAPYIYQIYTILECLESKKHCKVIMDDINFHTKEEVTYGKVRRPIKSLIKEQTKNISKKCQLFKSDLEDMGNIIFIKDKGCVLSH